MAVLPPLVALLSLLQGANALQLRPARLSGSTGYFSIAHAPLKSSRPLLPPPTFVTKAVGKATGCRAPPVQMQEVPFVENVFRFMRFFITASTGLVAGLLSPFSAFLRTPTLTAIGAVLLVGVIVFFTLTLQGMMSPSAMMAPSVQDVAPDPSMQRMLQDIYGP
ncbi:hypothetical protein AB1Y20_013217 [Prymnesium parvum]|uniref:Uncharacterized protein ycf33 n=1 Tax=Prymnesium parvum TaxID=97485 RepID=A0AB34IMP9_PRYPA